MLFSCYASGQTDRQTDILITIHCSLHPGGEVTMWTLVYVQEKGKVRTASMLMNVKTFSSSRGGARESTCKLPILWPWLIPRRYWQWLKCGGVKGLTRTRLLAPTSPPATSLFNVKAQISTKVHQCAPFPGAMVLEFSWEKHSPRPYPNSPPHREYEHPFIMLYRVLFVLLPVCRAWRVIIKKWWCHKVVLFHLL